MTLYRTRNPRSAVGVKMHGQRHIFMPGRINFGVYELDPEALELRKHGVVIRLQEQPLRVLVALAARAGEIVTREQLQEQIWGKDTFVDFEQSLNKAVNRLRETLNDDASQPRYVETVPRRGYRFVAPIIQTSFEKTQGLSGSSSKNSNLAPLPPNSARRHRAAILAAIAAGVLVATGVSAAFWWKRSQSSPVQEPVHMSSSGCDPTLSWDGKFLAYSDLTGGVLPVWVQPTTGGEASQITNGSDPDFFPDFSPDGTYIVFYSE